MRNSCVRSYPRHRRQHQAFHAGPRLPAPLHVYGLNRPRGGDQIGDLVLGLADSAPCPDDVLGRGLVAVLDAADLGEVAADVGGQRPGRETRVLADLTQPDAKRLAGLLGLATAGGTHGRGSTAPTPPRTPTGRAG